jgi:hypothetical protein
VVMAIGGCHLQLSIVASEVRIYVSTSCTIVALRVEQDKIGSVSRWHALVCLHKVWHTPSVFKYIRYFRFVKQMYLDKF